jgi:hypothetical protein
MMNFYKSHIIASKEKLKNIKNLKSTPKKNGKKMAGEGPDGGNIRILLYGDFLANKRIGNYFKKVKICQELKAPLVRKNLENSTRPENVNAVKEHFKNLIQNVEVVHSTRSGLGKTFYITEKVQSVNKKKVKPLRILLSKNLDFKTNLRSYKDMISHVKSNGPITIKIVISENCQETLKKIDDFLFNLTILKIYVSDNSYITLNPAQKIFIEIQNNGKEFVLDNVSILSVFKEIKITKFNLSELKFDEFPGSSIQRAAKFLEHYDRCSMNLLCLSKKVWNSDHLNKKDILYLFSKYIDRSIKTDEATWYEVNEFARFINYHVGRLLNYLKCIKNDSQKKNMAWVYALSLCIIDLANDYIDNLGSDSSKLTQRECYQILMAEKKQRKVLVAAYRKALANSESKKSDGDPNSMDLMTLMHFTSTKIYIVYSGNRTYPRSIIDFISKCDYPEMRKSITEIGKINEDIKGHNCLTADLWHICRLEQMNYEETVGPKSHRPQKALAIKNPAQTQNNYVMKGKHSESSSKSQNLDPENPAQANMPKKSDRMSEMIAMKDKFMQEVSTFESKGYILNTDNFKKILFILQKAKMRVPIVLLGESGCGKTYMIKFIAKVLLQGAFKAITIHAGYSHQQLLSELKEICIEGKKVLQESQWGRIWVFFDELNTSPLQDLIAEIMIDRYCSFFDDPWIPKSVVFVAAGNPYRIKKRD